MREILGEARTVRALLKGVKYSIDYYQREYKWAEKQMRELVDDLTEKFLQEYDPAHPRKRVVEYPHYFLGSIIVSKKESASFIVDGQQRLTSITLLLILLRSLQEGRPDAVNVDELIVSEKYGQKSFNLDVDERAPCMTALYEGVAFDPTSQSESVQNLYQRYRDLEDAFPPELRDRALPYFVDWLLENVQLVEIKAFADDDAYTIFETMNDRGLSLSPTDMLKGYLLANVDEPKERAGMNSLWKERVRKLAGIEKDTDTDFFKSWLRSQSARSIRERKKGSAPGDFDRIGSEFHRWVRDTREQLGLTGSDGFLRFIQRDFDFYSRHYLRLTEASTKLTEGLEHIFYNAQAGFTLQPMLLLAPITVDDPQEVVDQKWGIAARYLDIFLTRRHWNYRSVDQSTMKYPIFQTTMAVRGMAPAPLAEQLAKELKSQTESFGAMPDFALHGTNRKTITRILARMTSYVEERSGGASRYLEYTASRGGKRAFEIEHIWADKFERHGAEFDHESDFHAYRNRLGGLLLLPKSFNASYGDLPYEEKVVYYDSQNLLARSLNANCYDHNPGFLRFMQEFSLPFKAYTHFGKADLDERGALYRKLAELVWNPGALLEIAGK